MAVRAKFYVAEVAKRASGRMSGYAAPVPLGDVILRPSGGAGNEAWASATPSGEFRMTIRSEALSWFEERLGRDVSILIEDVEDES